MGFINKQSNFPDYLQDQVEERKCGHKWYRPKSSGKQPGEGPCPVCRRLRDARKQKRVDTTGKFK